MNQLNTLYKQSASGATQEWTIGVRPEKDGTATIITEYGQLHGQLQVAEVKVLKGKNIGRSNETSPLRQAELEMASKHAKQLLKGYRDTLDKGVLAKAVEHKPMLAQVYSKHRGKIDFSKQTFVQPKLDGMRCLAHKENGVVTLTSRGNKPILTMCHIIDALETIMDDGDTWDGELYVHNEATFQEVISWVKRKQPDSLKVQYHVYDAIGTGSFEDRFWPVRDRIEDVQGLPQVQVVQTWPVNSHAEIEKYHQQYVAEGYEGVMVRHNDCPYREGARSSDLLKVKEFTEDEFEVVGMGEGRGKFEGLSVFKLKTKAGDIFDCVPRGTATQRKEYFDNGEALIGKMMTVRYFGWSTSDPPLPRIAVGLIIRDYE